jgi:hypothetical protein
MLHIKYIITRRIIKKSFLIGKNMKNIKISKILGIITMCINVLLLIDTLYMYYRYNFTNLLFLFKYPNWMLLINAVLGIIGISMSIMLYKKAVSIKLFLIVTLSLWFVILSNYCFPIC